MDLALNLLGILLIALGVGISIALHELGHLVPAKRFGVKCTQFMIGFGPTVWSSRKGETEIGVKAIPLGGYVRMIGMIPPRPGDRPGTLRSTSTSRLGTLIDQARDEAMDEVKPGDEDRVFYKLSVPKKIAVMAGGPLMNLALAVVLLTIMLSGVGVETVVPKVGRLAECVPTAAPTAAKPLADCAPGDPAAPSAAAGLAVGDRILSVNGTAVQRWSEVTAVIRTSAGTTMTLLVDSAGQQRTVTVPIASVTRAVFADPAMTKVKVNSDGSVATETIGYLGLVASTEFVRQPLSAVPTALWDTLQATGRVLLSVPEKVAGVWRAVTGQGDRDPDGLVSVVGVARAGGEIVAADLNSSDAVRTKVALILGLLFGINLALFLFNLLPMLPLDGGQIVGAVWEGVKRIGARLLGRPDPGYVDIAKGLPIAYAVSTLLIGMTILLVYADLVKPIKLS